MKNKGRKHMADSGNCKSLIHGLTRPIRSMSSNGDAQSKFDKKKWVKRMRGYFKTQRAQDLGL